MAVLNDNNTLPVGYSLHWYEIVDVIGRGGFGITYLARDKNLDLLVAIKEYLPTDFANRHDDSTVQPRTGEQRDLYDWGLERFVTEARILAKFTHPNIIRVLSVFEQNNTAYMVMEYAQGEDLSSYYKRRRKEHQPLDEQEYLDIFVPICDGLSLVHNEGFIHRDIKPANIYISRDNIPMLLDFGSARKSMAHKTKALTSLVTVGYAPFEQYQEGTGKQGPWTDIYSLGASIYVGITGKKPEDAMARGGQLLETGHDSYRPLSRIARGQFSEHFLLAVDNALMFKAENRPNHILRWADMLLGRVEAPALPKNLYQADETPELEKTVIMPRSRQTGRDTARSQPATTSRTRGSQGFVNSLGKRLRNISHEIEEPVQAGVAGVAQLMKTSLGKTRDFIAGLPTNAIFASVAILVAVIAVVVIINNMPEKQTPATSTTEAPPPPEPAVKQPSRVDTLLSQAHTAYKVQHYTQPRGSSAFDYLQSVLALEPDNQAARQGLRDIQQQLLQQAQAEHATGDDDSALASLAELLRVNPDNNDGMELQQTITGASQKQTRIKALLAKAETAYKQHHYAQPTGDNAYDYYRQVLQLDSANSQAKHGIQSLQDELLSQAKQAYQSGQYSRAQTFLTRFKHTGGASKDAETLAQKTTQQLNRDQTINRLLAKAREEFKRRRFTSPAKNNAFDTYSEVLKLDRKNQSALAGIESIKRYYRQQFQNHLGNNNLNSAAYNLQRLKMIDPGSKEVRTMEQSLRQKQLAQSSKPEIEQVSQLVGKYKSLLENRDLSGLKNISKFKSGRENFLRGLFSQYRKFDVEISGFSFIAKEHRAKAHVQLVRMTDKNNQVVLPGSWSKYDIQILRNKNHRYYVYW